MKRTLSELRARVERVGTLETDSFEERRNKVTLLVLSGICFFASIVWGTMYLAILGPTITVFITYGFTLVIGAALCVFFATKRFALLLYPFFLMILWNPIAMQWSLGGFAASGVLMTWSMLAPLCALMFQTVRAALWWFAAYLVLLAVSLALDQQFQPLAPPLSQQISMLFFAMNIVGPSVAIFLTMLYFVKAFQREHERSENLLLNILPAPIAERLKEGDEVIANANDDVTILFADIVGFTEMAAQRDPEQLVVLLNGVFSAFDHLTARYGLEKIKTIGDAYMVAAGLPEPRPDHAEAAASLALDMRAEAKRISEEVGVPLSLRVGINTGPVVAGVIGARKFAYDLWGDAVNTASRMESHGVEDCIQLTESTYQHLKSAFECEERGVIAVKGKADMKTYFLIGKRS
ncbi:MAG: adenylate/guanylate cyclase domain-containing protein [Alphaproteobacteria bacterium]|jgi:guanylate cyclase|nr:adenylate/guanylate cyclase domain-containing protein [Alphaproteobacteria bacterium]MDP6565300.1 adenylate/guanylate cyclase domain-containing protein [Alphaproteobacteria bacterium]MDP6812067.1 adenylate/guanylate cyclase domain-containing protein [Alphaproteobacteria bacterium]